MKFFAVNALFHVSAEIYYKKTAQNLRGFLRQEEHGLSKSRKNAALGQRCIFVNYVVDLQRVALWSYGVCTSFLHT